MPSPDRRMTSGRRRPTPAFDHLEGRQLMSNVPTSALAEAATTKAHHLAAVHHGQVTAAATTKAHHLAANHHAQVSAAARPKVDSTHHLLHLSSTPATHFKATSTAKVKSSGIVPADYVLRYPYVKPAVTVKRLATYSPIGGFSPAQVTGAYGVSSLVATNQGQGTTIAIIDAYVDPTIISDTNIFSAQYGLPKFNATVGGPTLTVVSDTFAGNVPNAPVGSTGEETALDVEWAHAIAPQANILLVFVAQQSFPSLLEGVQYAAKQPGVDTISLSYGGPDVNAGAYSIPLNATYLANGPAAALPVTVSTGDGALPGYPATSDNVIAVGGTSLSTTGTGGTTYGSETAWGGPQVFTDPSGNKFYFSKGAGGGGVSGTYGSPTFQSAGGVAFPNRTVPDLAAIADPYTGVAFYDSYDSQGGNPWNIVGGTSLAAPVVSAMIDLAQQNRILAGKPLLNSVQINTADYAAYNNPTQYASLFHDVTMGTNQDYQTSYPFFSAGLGYDLTTGVGTPKANTFVPYLSGL